MQSTKNTYAYLARYKTQASTIGTILLAFSSASFAAEANKSGTPNSKKASEVQNEELTLETVNVSGSAIKGPVPGEPMPVYAGGQVATGGRVGILGDKSFMDTPYSVINYTKELIQNQQATTLADVVANDPSIRNINPRFGRFDQFTIRGFNLVNSEVAFNGLFGLVPTYTVPLEGVERVEVLKGPNTLLNGMSPSGAVGGTINIVPKRASDDPITSVTATYASKNVFGGHVDLGRRFGTDNQFGIRLNAVHQDGQTSFSNNQSIERGLVTVGLDFRGDRLRLSTDISHLENRGTAPLERVGLRTISGQMVKVPDADRIDRNFAQQWSYANTIDTSVAFRGEYDITSTITTYAGFGARRGRYDFLRVPVSVDALGNFSARSNRFIRDEDAVSAETGIRAKFDTGFVNHTVNLSANLFKIQFNNLENEFGTVSSNIYNPIDNIAPNRSGLSNSAPRAGETQLESFALTDTLSILDDRVQLTLGARRQRVIGKTYRADGFKTAEYDENGLTPTVALLVKPTENLSLYGNYIEALSQTPSAPTSPTTGPDRVANPGEIFPPTKSKQVEAGVKLDMGRYTTTLSLFRIERPSTFIDPITRVFALNGEQHNIGVELNVFGEPVDGVRVLGGFMLLDAELKKTSGGINDGNTAVGVARTNVNLGAEWDPSFLSGLTLTARTIYTGDQYVNEANTREIPDWTRFDIGSRYTFKSGGKTITLRANVENVFDKRYWSTASTFGLTYATPRTAFLSATIDF